MIYLLGGPPRVGKSLISGMIRQKHALSVVSTDSIGAVLENVWDSESAPDFFVKEKYLKMSSAEKDRLIVSNFRELFEYVRQESQTVWKAVTAFTRREHEEGRDILIEGVGVLPALVYTFDELPHRVVFVGNQGNNHKENIKKSAQENGNDWMRNRSDQYISMFALFVKQMSVYIEREANRYGFAYIEMENKSFENIQEEIMMSFGLSIK